jgi:hypothetical protein
MPILIKEHICPCGRKSKVYKKCTACRSKDYKKNTADRKNEKAGKENNDDIIEFYNHHIDKIKKMNARCEECSVIIFKPDIWNVAHILPKEHFPSVRSHKDNCMYLCRLHHGKFDMSFESAKTMNVWETAVDRYKSFKSLVKETHKILNQFD